VLLAACYDEQPDPSGAARAAATQTATAQPPPATATSSSSPTALVSSPTAPAATPTPPQPTEPPQPTQTAPPETAPAATGTTPPEPTPAATVAAPTATASVTQAADILTTLPEFTLPEVGPSAATAYDPKGLVRMRGFSPFIPLDNPLPVPAATATWLHPDDFVLGVKRGGEVRAYPISQVEYHHIVNDTIAGEPYLVTY